MIVYEKGNQRHFRSMLGIFIYNCISHDCVHQKPCCEPVDDVGVTKDMKIIGNILSMVMK